MNGTPVVHDYINEKVLTYEVDGKDYRELMATYEEMKSQVVDIPIVIGGVEIRTDVVREALIPHDRHHVIGTYYLAGEKEAQMAIDAALKARVLWARLPWEQRVSVFLRAAELARGSWRARLNAATMLSQSKTYKQAEIDSAAELTDFLMSNAQLLSELYVDQPYSPKSMWNRTEYRPLEGFVFAVSPFNFTSIAANLSAAPAIAGNTVVWKPSNSAVYSGYVIYQLFKEAGLPDGVINFLPGNSSDIGDVILTHPSLSGIHFTGSTQSFRKMYKTIGDHIDGYKTFPRLIGETGGKNYVLAHDTADLKKLARGLRDGAFEYQGQKCSAASRAYIPESIWEAFKPVLIDDVQKIKVGDVEQYDTFMGAVIDEGAFKSITSYIDYAKASEDAQIIYGGGYDDAKGYFIEPTIIVTTDPHFKTMEEEIFGPVLTIYLYTCSLEEVMDLVDQTSIYGLTGAIFAEDRYIIHQMEDRLVDTVGNFYINVRPTGAVVGQQPFGGARASGTNDKAGAKSNVMRWVSGRVIKEQY